MTVLLMLGVALVVLLGGGAVVLRRPSVPDEPREVVSYCRICEAHCGLRVTVESGQQITQIRPDRDHPVTQGYGCRKGMGLGRLHHDPQRLSQPLKRVDGRFQPISWEQAIAEIGARLKTIRREHGPRAIGMYRGNPSFFSFQHVLFANDFMRALGSVNLYTSVSVDSNNKFWVATELYGHPLLQVIPDLPRTHFLLCLGSNPLVSQMSIIQASHPLRQLQEIEQRGGEVVFVDPRRTETADRVGRHLFIRPGTDAALLLGLIHVLSRELGVNRSSLDLSVVLEHAQAWTPERVSTVTGIEPAALRALATSLADAPSAAIYHSTGVNMSGHGSVCTWLIHAASALTGNLDREGGLMLSDAPFDLVALSPLQARGRDQSKTLVHGFPRVAGAFPSGALADEITTDHPQRIRALIVSAGNPAHSIPGDRFTAARERLELVVSIDLYLGETAAMADYVLPATDSMEHSDFPVGWMDLQVTPYAQFTPAVVPAAPGRRPEWRIFSDLAMAAGVGPFHSSVCAWLPWMNRALAWLPGRPEISPDHLLAALLWWGGQTRLSELRRNPSGLLGRPLEPGNLAKRVAAMGGRIRTETPGLLEELERFEAWATECPPDGALQIIGLRERKTHNSWMHSHDGIRPDPENLLRLHPEDASVRGVGDGDLVLLVRDGVQRRVRVRVTDEVMRGVVALPHGWGHQASGVEHARALGGVNLNAVLPGGGPHLEPHSGQARMTGHYVWVQPVEAPTPQAAG